MNSISSYLKTVFALIPLLASSTTFAQTRPSVTAPVGISGSGTVSGGAGNVGRARELMPENLSILARYNNVDSENPLVIGYETCFVFGTCDVVAFENEVRIAFNRQEFLSSVFSVRASHAGRKHDFIGMRVGELPPGMRDLVWGVEPFAVEIHWDHENLSWAELTARLAEKEAILLRQVDLRRSELHTLNELALWREFVTRLSYVGPLPALESMVIAQAHQRSGELVEALHRAADHGRCLEQPFLLAWNAYRSWDITDPTYFFEFSNRGFIITPATAMALQTEITQVDRAIIHSGSCLETWIRNIPETERGVVFRSVSRQSLSEDRDDTAAAPAGTTPSVPNSRRN